MIHGEGFTADELAELTGKTVQAVRASLKTAIKHGLVETRRERDEDTQQWVNRYFLTLTGKLP